MARKPTKKTPEIEGSKAEDSAYERINLAKFLSTKAVFAQFSTWIVGLSPLICHAWSKKAKDEMLFKQIKALKPAKEARDPESEFFASLYEMGEEGEGVFGFPATAVKKCLLSVAHKDKGVPRELVMRSLWINAKYVSVRPALAGAICDLPLVRLWGSEPLMREDMVRIGAGMRKTATLAYRATFRTWGIRITGRYNASVLNEEVIQFLAAEAGVATGIGDWRNEKGGSFGSFKLASIEEAKAWDRFARGAGPLPEIDDGWLQAAE